MFSIIIPTYNNPYITRTLESITKLTKNNLVEVVVVIHTTATAQLERITKFKTTATIDISIIKITSRNVPIARNIGILAAKYDKVIFVDDDCIVPQNYIDFLIQHSEHPLIKGGVLFKKTGKLFSNSYAELRKDWYSNPKIPYTPNLIVEKNLYTQIGFFDEYAHGGEDVEWGVRAAIHNVYPYYISNLVLHHLEESFNKKIIGTWRRYGKNKAYIFIKYYSERNYNQCFKILKRLSIFNGLKGTKSISYNMLVLLINILQIQGFLSNIYNCYRIKSNYIGRNAYIKSKEYIDYCNSFKEAEIL